MVTIAPSPPTVVPSAPPARALRIVHVVNDADAGGAQTLLEQLGAHADPDWELHLVVLRGRGALSARLEGRFASTTYLGFHRGSWRLDRLVREVDRACGLLDPDVVHSHLLQADLAVGLGRRGNRGPVRVASVHTTGYSRQDPWRTRVVSRVMGLLARRMDAVIACTPQARDYMAAHRYPAATARTVRNGIAVPAEAPVRDLPPATFLSLARWHPLKDHATLIGAFARVREVVPQARLVCAGVGMDDGNPELVALLAAHGVTGAVELRGPIDDVPGALAEAAALVISSSYGEALPMAGIEAVAFGTPVLTTEVGDAPALTVEAFQRVLPRRPDLLAEAMVALLELPPARYAELVARSHALGCAGYDIRDTVAGYDQVYREALAAR